MPGIFCLLAVWVAIAVALRAVQSRKPTVNSVLAMLESRPAAGETADVRRAWIGAFSSRLARLDMDSRHLVLMNPRLRAVFLELSPEDRSYFLKVTETPWMREFVEGSKEWSKRLYKGLMTLSLSELEDQENGSRARIEARLASPAIEAVKKDGIEAYLKDTDPLTMFDIRPLIERIQKNCQMGR